MGNDISNFMSDVVDVVTTPFREVSKMITGVVSDQAHAGIDLIHDAESELGIDTVAENITDGTLLPENHWGNCFFVMC